MGARNGNDLAVVRARFDAWRRHKLSRRIPEDLWHDAIALLVKHSVTEICEHLGLNSWRFSRKQGSLHKTGLLSRSGTAFLSACSATHCSLLAICMCCCSLYRLLTCPRHGTRPLRSRDRE